MIHVASAVLPLENKLMYRSLLLSRQYITSCANVYVFLSVKWLDVFNHLIIWLYVAKSIDRKYLKCSIKALSSACVHWKNTYNIYFFIKVESMLTKLIFCPLCHICFSKNQTGDPEKNGEWFLKNIKRLISHSREEWSPCAISVCFVKYI